MGHINFLNLLDGGCPVIAAATRVICGCDVASGQMYETGRAGRAGACVQV